MFFILSLQQAYLIINSKSKILHFKLSNTMWLIRANLGKNASNYILENLKSDTQNQIG